MRATLNRLGIALRREFTMVFIPSSFEIILNGRNALSALNPRRNVKLFQKKQSKNQFNMDDTTITKSNIFQDSFKQVSLPKTKPRAIIFIKASPMKNIEIIVVIMSIVPSKQSSSIEGELIINSKELRAIRWYMKSSKQLCSRIITKKRRKQLSGLKRNKLRSSNLAQQPAFFSSLASSLTFSLTSMSEILFCWKLSLI